MSTTAHPIQFVNVKSPLIRVEKCDVVHPGGHIYSMKLSHNGHILATASTCGSVRLWETTNYQLIYELRVPPALSKVSVKPVNDEKAEPVEKHVIDEFYFAEFAPNDKIVIVGGKRKDRHEWDPIDDDNKILACPLILFDLDTIANEEEDTKDYNIATNAVTLFEGHTEEILCFKYVVYNDEPYYVTGSFDGTIMKWCVNKDDYKTLVKSTQISDNVSNVISSLDFVPGTNNKYLVAGADNSIKVYDFEAEQIVHTFPTDYTSYCDCVKFVTLLDQEQVENSFALISRGVETVNEDTNRTLRYYIFNIIEPQANSKCQLHRLKMIKTPGRGKKKNTEVISFELETVHTYLHPEFTSNSWLIKINTNGRYLFSPTSNGKIFIWNMATTKLAAILHDHGDEEVRDLLLHPTKPFLFTCGDDASVKVYKSEPKAAKKVVPNGEEKKDEEMGEKENDTMEETDD